MEAEVGTPINYNPDDFMSKEDEVHQTDEQKLEPENNDQYYFPPPQQPYYEPYPQQAQKEDIFTNLDKTAYIIIFVSFILGFFMGKTMQPVILRPG